MSVAFYMIISQKTIVCVTVLYHSGTDGDAPCKLDDKFLCFCCCIYYVI